MHAKDSKAILSYFRGLAESREPVPFGAMLRQVAAFFDAAALGMTGIEPTGSDCVFETGTVRGRYPWQTAPNLLTRIRTSLCAESYHDAAGHWLVNLVSEPGSGEPQIVWALRSRSWSEADCLSWMAVSQALLRRRMQATGEAMKLRRRLEVAAQVTGRLSHDFGNYLTGILGFTELSLTQVPADSTVQRFLQEVLQSAKQGAEWIRRLHLFCRRGAMPAWPTPIDKVLAAEETRMRSAGGFPLRWQTDLPADLPLVDIDAGELQLVLAELVNNSREACRDQGSITFMGRVLDLTDADCRDLLGAAQPGPHVELTVADDGPGIAAEDRAKWGQEIFFTSKPRQRGLGLLIVYGCMQRCRGALRIAAPNGNGTAFQLYLPVAAMPAPTGANFQTLQVLLVSANPQLESRRRMLEASGYRVEVANSAAAALSAFTSPSQAFDLVIMDVILPQTSGFDLARRMLEHQAKTNFLFLHTSVSFHGLADEELVKRFPVQCWPMAPPAFLQAVQSALAPAKKE